MDWKDRGKKSRKEYIKALEAFYGDVMTTPVDLSPTVMESHKPLVSKPKELSEQQEQFIVVARLKKAGINLHHSPNGGKRDAIEGAKLKRLGTAAGFPDLYFPAARKGYHSLFIELKRRSGGVLSEVQKLWRDILITEGHAWYMAKGADECIRIVEDYFDIKIEE